MSMCSMCDAASSPAVGVSRREKKEGKKGKMWGREQETERMSNELRWFRHLHSLPAFFRKEEEGKKRRG